jgi:uncharacterized delta-60 repeat protein
MMRSGMFLTGVLIRRPTEPTPARRRARLATRRVPRRLQLRVEPMEDRLLLAAGALSQLDASFGYQGMVPCGIGADSLVAYPDGRLLVAAVDYPNGVVVQRFTADGQLDPSFGSLGTSSTVPSLHAIPLGLGQDGKIFLTANDGIDQDILLRTNPDGSLDPTFGNNGMTSPIEINYSGKTVGLNTLSLAVLSDGRVLAGGYVFAQDSTGNSLSPALAMIRTDGTLDPSFHGNGTLVIPESGYGRTPLVEGLQIINNQVLVRMDDLNSNPPSRMFVDRFNLDGSLDTTFGSGGKADAPLSPTDSSGGQCWDVQPDGKITLAWVTTNSDNVFVARYNVDGSPDQSFGTGGQVSLDDTVFKDQTHYSTTLLAHQANGKVVLSALAYQPGAEPQLVRLNTDGSVDTTFGSNGLLTIARPQVVGVGYPLSMLVQSSGRVIMVSQPQATGGTRELVGIAGDPVVGFGDATRYSGDPNSPTAVYEVLETAGSASITLKRGGDLSQPVSVHFATSDNASAGINYTPVNTTVTFAAGSPTATVSIPILNNPNAFEGVDVPLVLGTPTGGAVLGNFSVGDLRIVPLEGIAITPAQLSSVMQGGAGSTLSVVLRSVPTADVTVPLLISTTSPQATLSTLALVFTPANALVPQVVTVTAGAGASGSGTPPIATVVAGPATSSDPKYNGLHAGSVASVAVYASTPSSAGSIEFAAASFLVNENAGTATIKLVRLGGSHGSASVHFATSDGTLNARGKYTPVSGSISFADGQTSRSFTVALIDPGHNLQGDQTVNLTLSHPTGGASLGVLPTATLTLHGASLSRLTAGDLDPSFGTGGRSVLFLQGGSITFMTCQDGDKILAVGFEADGLSVWRTDASGNPDRVFGQHGLALIPMSTPFSPTAVTVGGDGKIIVGGAQSGAALPTLLRLNADGTLDTTFGNGGFVTSVLSPNGQSITAVATESDGSILVTGAAYLTPGSFTGSFVLAHYGPDGSLDIGLGTGGVLAFPDAIGSPTGLVQQPDGKWLLTGGGGRDAAGAAIRLNADLSRDPTFGTGGIAPLDFGEFYWCATLQPDGKILIGGTGPYVARLNTNGSLDTTFGSGGVTGASFGGEATGFTSVLVQSDGKIVAMGYSASPTGGGSYVIEARFLPNGSIDRSFADNGSRLFGISSDGGDTPMQAVALADGRIVLASNSHRLPVLVAILTTTPGAQTTSITAVSGSGNAGDTATLKATLTANGLPLAGKSVDFTLTMGTVVADVGTAVTAANGVATLGNVDLSGFGAGTFPAVIGASFAGDATDDSSIATGTLTVNAPLLTTTIAGVSGAGKAGSTATLTATLTANSLPLAGKTMAFTLTDGTTVTNVGTATTNASGVAMLGGVDLSGFSAGTFPTAIAVNFAGDTADRSSSAAGTLTVSAAIKPATLTLGSLGFTYDGKGHAAIVKTSPAGLTGVTLTYTLNGQMIASPTKAGNYAVTAALNNANYAAPSVSGTLVISEATPTVSWAKPAAIISGTALGAKQLDATASFNGAMLAGTFAYAPATGTVLKAGLNQALSVIFTPTDAANFQTASSTTHIDVTPGPPTKLLITKQPTSPITAGAKFSVTVKAEDASGNVVSSFKGAILLALGANPGGSVLGGKLKVAAVNGVATFTGLTLNKAADGYTLKATFSGLKVDTTGHLHVIPAAATHLVFTTQPPGTVAHGTAFGSTVKAEDAFGNVATSFKGAVTLGLASNPGRTVLSGPLRITAIAGTATFKGLTLSKAGKGYMLKAFSTGLAGATTRNFNVT